jgi:hypothetical protein
MWKNMLTGWPVILMLLAVVAVGVAPFSGGCEKMYVLDHATNVWRPATDGEQQTIAEKVAGQTATVAETVALATGRPQYVPLIDVAARLAALIAAYFIATKKKTAATTIP